MRYAGGTLNGRLQGTLTLLAFVLVALTAFFAARHWQASQDSWTRVQIEAGCDLHQGACRHTLGGGAVVFSISPAEIPLMKPLRLQLVAEGVELDAVTVEIRGLNMDMGLNRTRLEHLGGARWAGETILPVCSQRTMEWEAAVLVEAGGRFELPFRFSTTRP